MDAADPGEWSVQVDVDAASLDSWAERRDAALKKPEYLNVEHFPLISFRSTRIEPQPDGELLVHGDLSMIGVTREVCLNARLNGETVDPRGLRRRGFGAHTSIRWSDFAPEPAPSGGAASAWTNSIFRDEIGIEVQVEFVYQDSAG